MRKFREVAHNICKLRQKTPKEISVIFHNGSTYDYHFIIKQRAKEFDVQFECYKKECKGCKERRKLNQYAILSDVKIINYITNARNVKKDN